MRRGMYLPSWILAVILASFSVLAQDKPACAVVSIGNGVGISADEAKFVGDRLAALLKQEGTYRVVERSAIPGLLTAAGLDDKGACETVTQAVEIGKAIGARYVIFGRASHLGALYSLSTSLVDVQKESLVRTALADRKGDLTDFAESGPAANLTSLLALKQRPSGWPVRKAGQADGRISADTPVTATMPAPAPPPSRKLKLDAAGNPKLVVKSVQKGRDGKYMALIEGIGVVKPGEVVRVKKGGVVYTWRITSITEKGLAHTKVVITPPVEK